MAARWLPAWGLVSWNNELAVRQVQAIKDMNMEAEEAMAVEAVTWQQPGKIKQIEKS
jgi:hypothetical protein